MAKISSYIEDEDVSIPKGKWDQLFTEDINGISYSVDAKLNPLIECIKSSLYILALEDGWADDEGVACTDSTFNNAVALLVNYAHEVLDNYGILIKNPAINLCKDGSIDLEWRTPHLILLMNITNNNVLDVHFYGEDFRTQTILKGFLDNLQPNRDLTFWMQKLKKNE